MNRFFSTVLCAALIAAAAFPGQATRYDSFALLEPGSGYKTVRTIASSKKGRRIDAYRYGTGEEIVLFMAGFHGDEPQSVDLLVNFCKFLSTHRKYLDGRTAIVIPGVNPDGLAAYTRTNSNGVDINRNFPTENWEKKSQKQAGKEWGGSQSKSESETQMVVQLLSDYQPARIISVHAPARVVNYDGLQSKGLAVAMQRENRYTLTDYIGYKTPGSLGTYAGKERNIPMVTLELPPSSDAEGIWKQNKKALLAALVFPDALPDESHD